MKWYLQVLKKYADFKGRARRKEYWMFVLFNWIFAITFGIIDITVIDLSPLGYGILHPLYCLIMVVPSIAVAVRRLHDIGKSGWYYLIFLIPLVGAIILIAWFCKEGEQGTNQWGSNPKQI